MEIRDRSNGELLTISQFKGAHPNTSFPKVITAEVLDLYGYDPVLNGAQPAVGEYEVIRRDGVEEVNGQWFTKFAVADKFQEILDDQGAVVKTVQEQKDAHDAAKLDRRIKGLDYRGFWKEFTRSASYAALKTAASSDLVSNVLATELISVFSDAKTGNLDSEAMLIGINEALAALGASSSVLATETEDLLTEYGLDVFIVAV